MLVTYKSRSKTNKNSQVNSNKIKTAKKNIYDYLSQFKGDLVINTIISSYYKEPMNIKKGLVSKKIVKQMKIF